MAAAQLSGEQGRSRSASRAGRDLARQQREKLQTVHKRWCERHPGQAAEERQLRQARREREERFGHKVNGTVETHAKASTLRQSAMMRLYRSGAITIQQWGASLEIAAAYERVVISAGVPTTWSMMDRVDTCSDPEAGFERLGGVWSEMAYSAWRRALPVPGPVVAMIVDDIGLDAAAQKFSMHKRRAKRLLIDALNAWARCHMDVRQTIDQGQLDAAHRALQ